MDFDTVAETATSMTIAETIRDQIGKRTLMAIGAKHFYFLKKDWDIDGGLQFSASLFGKRQCVVRVELTPMDTYRVIIMRPRVSETIYQAKDVHVGELSEVVTLGVEAWFKGITRADLAREQGVRA